MSKCPNCEENPYYISSDKRFTKEEIKVWKKFFKEQKRKKCR
jgi:hypothetical protein